MHTRVRQITVHTVYFCQVFTAALGTDVHFQFLVTTVVAIGKGQVHALIKSHFHCASYKRLDGGNIVINRVFDILYLAAV